MRSQITMIRTIIPSNAAVYSLSNMPFSYVCVLPRIVVTSVKCIPHSGDFNKAVAYQKKAIDLVPDKELIGIGISAGTIDGHTRIENVIANTPAHKSGLVIGDMIEAVNGRSTAGLSVESVAGTISGPVDTEVRLTIRRLNKEMPEDITLVRGRIANPVISAYEARLRAFQANKPWRE